VRLLSAQEFLYLQHRLVEETGGSHGVREIGLLESALQAPMSGLDDQEFSPSLPEEAAVFMSSIVQNRPFVDGNRRTGISVAAVLLDLNGYKLTASQQEIEDFAVFVATDHPTVDDIADWLRSKSAER
jgi:death-on-curing protein